MSTLERNIPQVDNRDNRPEFIIAPSEGPVLPSEALLNREPLHIEPTVVINGQELPTNSFDHKDPFAIYLHRRQGEYKPRLAIYGSFGRSAVETPDEGWNMVRATQTDQGTWQFNHVKVPPGTQNCAPSVSRVSGRYRLDNQVSCFAYGCGIESIQTDDPEGLDFTSQEWTPVITQELLRKYNLSSAYDPSPGENGKMIFTGVAEDLSAGTWIDSQGNLNYRMNGEIWQAEEQHGEMMFTKIISADSQSHLNKPGEHFEWGMEAPNKNGNWLYFTGHKAQGEFGTRQRGHISYMVNNDPHKIVHLGMLWDNKYEEFGAGSIIPDPEDEEQRTLDLILQVRQLGGLWRWEKVSLDKAYLEELVADQLTHKQNNQPMYEPDLAYA